MANSTTRIVQIPSELSPVAVLGAADSNLIELEKAFPSVDISVHADCVKIVSRSARSEKDACKAEHALRKIVDCAYEAPVDSYAVRRMLERDVLKGNEHNVRIDRIGHNGGVLGGVFSGLKSFDAGSGDGAGFGSGFSSGSIESDFARDSADLMPSSEDTKRRAMSRKARMAKGVITFAGGKPVRAKTAGQTAYVQAMESNTITFGIGPAGTGKTYLAVAKAVRALKDGRVRRIVLTRPAVEAGENLGFLPGTLNDKVDPYLRPLYDALSDMLGAPQLKRYMDENVVEVAPLAYMRGRTLNDAFVILDEAQNATVQQLKMFLTRLGFNTTMVITGDRTQVDLAVPKSGLASIENVLKDVKSIAFVHLNAKDVVRAELVGRIVEAYEAWEKREADFRREKADARREASGARGKSPATAESQAAAESPATAESQNLERNIK
ncbi:PhoH family protein [Gardnerella vaginalis]|uniref:PhoH family protein n=1 Tax=Gardnerella vaginalis TaxID=2702 RepID=UPI0039F02B0C